MKKKAAILMAILVLTLTACDTDSSERWPDIEESSGFEESADIGDDSAIGNQPPITFQKIKPAFDETLPFDYSIAEYDFNEEKYLQAFDDYADVKPSCTYTGYPGKEFFASYGYWVINESSSPAYAKDYNVYAYINKSGEVSFFDEVDYDIESTLDIITSHRAVIGKYLYVCYLRFDSEEAFLINMETNEHTPFDVEVPLLFSGGNVICLRGEEPAEPLQMYNLETHESTEFALDIELSANFYGPNIDGDIFYIEEQGDEALLCRHSIYTEQTEKYVIANTQSDYYYQTQNELTAVFSDKYAVIQFRANHIDTRRITFVLNLKTKALTQLDSQLSVFDVQFISGEQVIFRDESTESYPKNTNVYFLDLPTLSYNTIPTSLRNLKRVEKVGDEVVIRDYDGHFIIITP